MTYLSMNQGFIELIVGCMFAGKTEELIRRVSVLRRAGKKVLVFKPFFDNQNNDQKIFSHAKNILEAHPIKNLEALKKIVEEHEKKNQLEALAFDEIQFFPGEFVDYFETLANKGYRVICAGLDKGFNDELFPPVMRILAKAEFVLKLLAICVLCGSPASKTQRIDRDKKEVDPSKVKNVIGGSESYQARCRKCFIYFPVNNVKFC